MRYLFFICLFTLTIFSCQENNNSKEKELLEKENELLKRENELMRNENSNVINTPKDNSNQFEYKTYYNSNRQFKIDYPSFLTMGPAPENGDGREFISDGGEIRLWTYSTYYTDQSISQLYFQELNDENYTITYKVLKTNWYVVSGIDNENGKEFYKKVYYSNQDGGQIRTMFLQYPQTKEKDFDIIIPKMVQTFKDI